MTIDPDDPIMHALIERVVKRTAETRTAEALPLRRQLPGSKAEFPKLLCLDQNKWVDLARAHFDHREGASFKPALAAVRQAVSDGKLVVPVTGANLGEATEPRDEGRRERLVRFMVDLSQNHSLVNHVVVMREELRRGVLTLFLGRRSPSPLRASLLQRGMFAAITGKYPIVETGEPELDGLVGDALYDPELAVASIVKFRDRTSVESFREKDREAAGVVESIRKVDAHLTVDDRRNLELGNLLREGSVADMLDEALLATGVDQKTFRCWLEDDSHQAAFTNAVPGINVTSTLMLARDQNQGHRTHPNDGKDFSFFQVAVPYSNILVAEKSWSHFAVSSGLAKLYGTLVLRDARAIPEALKDAGCL